MMNNYTVDVSIFLLNEDEFLKADEKRKGTLVKDVCRTIDKYIVLCDSVDNSVFFPKFDTNEFLEKLENNAFRKYSKEIEQLLGDGKYQYRDYITRLQKIIDNYLSEDGDYQRDWRQSFNNQFGIEIWLNDIQLVKAPDREPLKPYGKNFKNTLASIALLNQYIYHPDYNKHLFLYKGLTEFDDELAIISFIKSISIEDVELEKIIKNPDKLEGLVKKKSLKRIEKEDRRFETLEKAVKQAQNEFSDNLIFGNDIDGGVKERNREAGPPDKVYYYLKTLNDITEIKRTTRPDWSLVLLARMYGCNGSGQSREIMYDDGNEKSGFVDHLKPAESESYNVYHLDDGNCIRIYFKWDGKIKKTIVGWIGEHP